MLQLPFLYVQRNAAYQSLAYWQHRPILAKPLIGGNGYLHVHENWPRNEYPLHSDRILCLLLSNPFFDVGIVRSFVGLPAKSTVSPYTTCAASQKACPKVRRYW